jgi:hypothetical protein
MVCAVNVNVVTRMPCYMYVRAAALKTAGAMPWSEQRPSERLHPAAAAAAA